MNREAPPEGSRVIGIVGPCSAGKSTLARGLTGLGYAAKSIGQEHSYVPHMWQVIGRPDLLVYLDVSYNVAQGRRRLDWQPTDLDEQRHRPRTLPFLPGYRPAVGRGSARPGAGLSQSARLTLV
jgi:ABC-type nitrate/sulfonate/bicarbonate transport system ATPase subunit